MRDKITKQRIAVLLAVLLVLGPWVPMGFALAEDLLAGFHPTSGTIHRNATDGPEVVTTKDYQFQDGNPFTDHSVNISTESNGWINVSSTDSTSTEPSVTIDEINGTFTNASNIDADNVDVTLNPSDKDAVTVGKGINSVKFKANMQVDDGTLDFSYTGTGDSKVVVETDATDGTQYGAVDMDTGEGLDVAVSSSGTLSFDNLEGGSHDVQIQELGSLFIREETPPHNQITSATVTVKFFENKESNPTIVERSTNNGEVDLTGLPVNEEFIVTANAAGYYNRTAVISDLSEQSSVFLLNQSVGTSGVGVVNNTFIINDRTGDFPPGDTQLKVEKAINRSEYDSNANGYEWTVLTGDNLGADQQLVVTLRFEDRYRLRVSNEEGDVRILGEYNAKSSGVIQLEIGTVSISPDESETFAWGSNYSNTSGAKFVNAQYNDPTDSTTDLRLIIHEYGNESNEIENSTHSGPFGTFSFNKNLTAVSEEAEDKEWVVKFEATRDGEKISGSQIVGRAGIGEGIANLDPMWLHVASVGLLFLLAGLVGGMVNPGAGAMVVAAVGGLLWYVQVLPPSIGGGAIALGMLVAAGYTVATSQGGAIR